MRDRPPPVDGEPPDPVSFRTELYKAGTVFPLPWPPWGELHYALQGVVDFDIDGTRSLSPSQYAIWLPPETPHTAWNHRDVRYASVYIAPIWCDGLPEQPATLSVSDLVKAILADFAARGVTRPQSPQDRRLAEVLVDQVRLCPQFRSYRPLSDDALLRPVLDALRANPGDRRSLADLAGSVNTTERTLARRCQSDLGVSFLAWRQRLKLVAAMEALEAGQPVGRLARRLGYGSASAFIAMFRRQTGTSPTRR